jgi:Helix-hairpin-helix motif
MRQTAAEKLVAERQRRPFRGIEDLIHRVPELQKSELVTLSEIGAFNSLGKGTHRRGPRARCSMRPSQEIFSPSSAGWITLLAKKIGGGGGPCNSNADGLASLTAKE